MSQQAMTLRLSKKLHTRLTDLAAKHRCTIGRLLTECADVGELLTEASRIELVDEASTGTPVRIVGPSGPKGFAALGTKA
jgi:predicted DNA-binding ribbon-helix-helix protein